MAREYVIRFSGTDESDDDFAERISSMLREGWTPVGGIAVYMLETRNQFGQPERPSVRLAQAMIR